METIAVIGAVLIALWFGIKIGANAKRPPQRVEYEGLYAQAVNEGYTKGRLHIKPGITLDELVLALHRNEGLLKAALENVTDAKEIVRTYGAQDDNSRT